MFFYALGVSLFAHAVMFLAVQYFGSVVFWFWLMVGSMVTIGLQARKAKARQTLRRPVQPGGVPLREAASGRGRRMGISDAAKVAGDGI